MGIVYALIGIIISVAGLTLLARKWNISTFPNQVKGTMIAFGVAVSFLWIYPLCPSTWLSIFCTAGQVALTFIIILSLVFYRFWRDPERIPVEDQRVILSSADGEVIYIKKIQHDSVPVVSKDGKDYKLHELTGVDFDHYGKDTIIIGIEMNIMNVHVNRCPIEGDVKLIQHIPGKFYSLRKQEAPFLNTRCTTIISNKELSVATVQIASRLVRKIDNYLSTGQSVCIGQRLGMIRFGSQVAVIIPDRENVRLEAYVGQVTRAGISILACY